MHMYTHLYVASAQPRVLAEGADEVLWEGHVEVAEDAPHWRYMS